MKKLFLFLILACSMMLVSCGSQQNNEIEDPTVNDTVAITVDSIFEEVNYCDTIVAVDSIDEINQFIEDSLN